MLRGGGLTDVPLTGGATVAPHTNTFVYDAALNQVRAYLDGVLVNTVAQGAVNLTGAGPFKVNGYSSNVGSPANGHYDEFRFYNRALSPAEITSLNNCSSGCAGTPETFTITVNPTPDAVATPASQTICSGAITPIVISGGVSGTIFNWTRDNTASITGIAASGSGDISGSLINTTGAPLTVTFTITPTANSCPGTAITAIVVVNPLPTVNPVSNQVLCNNSSTTAIAFSGAVSGTTYNWTNNTPSIGLAASGTGDIASFVATNAGNTPVVATITVTPTSTSGGGGGPVSVPFNFTGGMQTWTVPAGVTSIFVQGWGAQGGSGANGGSGTGGSSGLGGYAEGNLAVIPGQVLNIFVGGQGSTPNGGFNGGANGGSTNAGGGGGASDIRLGGTAPANRILTAGGGGGGGRGGCIEGGLFAAGSGGTGGSGGGGVGINGNNSSTSGGDAGGGFGGNAGSVQGAAGLQGIGCSGFLGQPGTTTATEVGGVGGGGQNCCCGSDPSGNSIVGGGGGGGGHIGGGGGGGGSAGTAGCSGNSKGAGGGGGGGSSYIGGVTSGVTNSGIWLGDGMVTISYNTVSSLTCTGTPETFTITVNPTPNAVATPASQTICSGAITPIVLSGAVSGTIFNWTRDNTAGVTGIAASGSGDISGSLVNTTAAPVTVTFTITPTANGCPGTPITATVLVNPTPVATATPASQTVCSGPITTIVLSSTVSGTTYAWTRDNTVNVTGIAASGSGDISGTLTNTTTVPQTVTFTIIPTSPDGCVGAAITATVTVNAVPTVTCPANITVSNDVNQCGAVVTYSPTITGIPVPTVTYTFIGATTASGSGSGSGSLFNIGTSTVEITATNTCGTVSCTFTVTVNDTQAPTITCPAAVTVSCAAAVPAANIGSVTAADNCPGVVVTHIGDVISGQTCANRFTVTRTYRATDATGNFAECTQIITVNDVTAPTITCPTAVTVSCAAAVPAVNIGAVTGVSDNCAGVVTITHQGDVISNQTCANRFTVTRTYRATDVCGNFTECTQIITVNDVTPPVITCPAAVTVSCAAAVPAVNIGAVTATDNCAGVVTITHISDVISNQTCANRFTVTRTYRATDVCGNFSQCTQIITVNDITAPVITCPANITVTTPFGSCTAVVNFTPTATDNCAGTPTIVSVPASGTAFPIGSTTVTSTATDACGNTSSCTFTITVLDGQLPVINTQPANRTVCAGQNATFSVVAVTSPNAGGPLSYQWQQWNGSAWVNVSGATASSFTVNAATVAMNTNTFRCVVTGLCTIVNSGAATLFVNPLPTISIAAITLNALQPTQSTNVVATVNPPGGSFVWTRNGTNIGVSGPTVGPLTVDNLGTYLAVYTDPNGCQVTSSSLVISALASDNIWIYPNPNNGQFSVRYYNQSGESATIRVFNALGQVVYQKATATGTPYSLTNVTLPATIANGVYVVKVMGANGKELAAKRIIVQRN